MLAKARYFPLKPEALRMQPGLQRFGTSFGNGAADALFFPRDGEHARYLGAKAAVLRSNPERFAWLRGEAEQPALGAVLEWMNNCLREEHAESPLGGPAAGAHSPQAFAAIAGAIAEDFVILQRDEAGAERVALVHVCFPSGWRPERILGQSFLEIHAPVPELTAVTRAAPRLVSALFERGPFVRFVWTLSQDDELDHHPDHGRRSAWTTGAAPGYLRVERQVTVSFPTFDASLFLIRTYLYSFAELTRAQRQVLAAALNQTSRAVLEYKGLAQALPLILAQLAALDAGSE